jgi:catechol-2,3-dioxygenase
MPGIAKLRAVVLDCPDPVALAQFYSALVGGEVTVTDDGDWVSLRDGVDVLLSFQRAADHQPPDWPNPDKPQQFHIDVTVDEIDTAEKEVLALGARKHPVQPGDDAGEPWRVYLDPAGHPFCLCWD